MNPKDQSEPTAGAMWAAENHIEWHGDTVPFFIQEARLDLAARIDEVSGLRDCVNGCNALLGLLQLLEARDDLPEGIRESILRSHRRQEAKEAVAKATNPNGVEQAFPKGRWS